MADRPAFPEPSAPTLSIVVEWENAKLSQIDRACRMLRSVTAQAGGLRPRLGGAAELIILYDHKAIDPAIIQRALDDARIDPGAVAVRVEAVDDLDYYAQKNAGAALASGDFVLFVDSDVVPEAGWMEALFDTALARSGAVVGGNTYLDPATFIGRSFGLFWFFPLRSRTRDVKRADNFFANSVIFPRHLIVQRPFQPIGVVRGQCVALAERLRDEGVAIWRVNGAQASHPAPNGIGHLVRRALCEGHDAQTMHRTLAGDRSAGSRRALKSVRDFGRHTTHSAKRIIRNRRAVGMPLYEMPAALLLAAGYFGMLAVGELVSIANPTLIPRRVSV